MTRTTALAIDFGKPRPPPLRLLGWALLLIATAVAAWVGWQYADLHQARQQSQAAWSRLQGQVSRPVAAASPEAQQKMKDELRRAAQVIDRIDAPWDGLFSAVESAFDERVTLLAVEPDTERKEVRLTAEAKDLSAMLDYLKQVRTSPILVDAYVASHQTNLQDPQRPVRFAILARWNTLMPAVAPPTAPATPSPSAAPASAGGPP
ncbi:MAG: hypothetical protein EKK46_02645 [Rhodocyclaceae bacterium]|nr:MAG: hypothetical protein EKK46_02645 [Rhodocyclaceae bacterium]